MWASGEGSSRGGEGEGEREGEGASLPGSERRALLARRGAALAAWQAWRALAETHPRALTLEELREELGDVDPRGLAADLALLEEMGAVEKIGEAYRDSGGRGVLKSASVADISQHGLAAMRLLFEELLPLSEETPPKAGLVTATLEIPAGRADEVRADIWRFVRERWAREAGQSGDAEVIILLGLGVRAPITTGAKGEAGEKGG